MVIWLGKYMCEIYILYMKKIFRYVAIYCYCLNRILALSTRALAFLIFLAIMF